MNLPEIMNQCRMRSFVVPCGGPSTIWTMLKDYNISHHMRLLWRFTITYVKVLWAVSGIYGGRSKDLAKSSSYLLSRPFSSFLLIGFRCGFTSRTRTFHLGVAEMWEFYYFWKRHVLLGLIRNDSQKFSFTKISFPLPLLLDFSYSHQKLLTHLFQQSISPCPIQCPRNATQCGLVQLGQLTWILCTTHTFIPELVVSEAAPGSQLSDDFSGLLWSNLPLYHS